MDFTPGGEHKQLQQLLERAEKIAHVEFTPRGEHKQRAADTPAGGGRADSPAGGGQAGATRRMGIHIHAFPLAKAIHKGRTHANVELTPGGEHEQHQQGQ